MYLSHAPRGDAPPSLEEYEREERKVEKEGGREEKAEQEGKEAWERKAGKEGRKEEGEVKTDTEKRVEVYVREREKGGRKEVVGEGGEGIRGGREGGRREL